MFLRRSDRDSAADGLRNGTQVRTATTPSKRRLAESLFLISSDILATIIAMASAETVFTPIVLVKLYHSGVSPIFPKGSSGSTLTQDTAVTQ